MRGCAPDDAGPNHDKGRVNAETANGPTDDRNLNQYTGGFLLQAEGGQPSACFLLRIRHDDPAILPRSHEQETPERILNHKPAAEAPRYKAIGNSMAVPCMAWLGRRLLQTLDNAGRTTAH